MPETVFSEPNKKAGQYKGAAARECDSPFFKVLREKTIFVRFSLFDVTLLDVPVLLRSRQGEWSIRTDGAVRGSHLFPAGQMCIRDRIGETLMRSPKKREALEELNGGMIL